MKHFARLTAAQSTIAMLAAASTLASLPPAASAGGEGSVQRVCAARTSGTYGFQCQGLASVGAGLEPVTFLGTVSGSASGLFEGTGVFSSSLGSARQRVTGVAQFYDHTCAGHIQYRIFLLGPTGQDLLELAPLDIDFVTVAGGREVLGTPNALPG
jgi:hypothetical protein